MTRIPLMSSGLSLVLALLCQISLLAECQREMEGAQPHSESTLIAMQQVGPKSAVSVRRDGCLYLSVDEAQTWHLTGRVPRGTFGDSSATMQFVSEADGWISVDNWGIVRTKDGGVHWEDVWRPAIPTPFGVTGIARGLEKRAWIVTLENNQSFVRFTPDEGKTWFDRRPIHSETAGYRAVLSLRGSVIVTDDWNGVWCSQDDGLTWKLALSTPQELITSLWQDQQGAVWALGAWGYLAKSLDAGRSWIVQDMSPTVRNTWLVGLCAREEHLWIGSTDGSIVFSEDSGRTWKARNLGPDNVEDIACFENRVAVRFSFGMSYQRYRLPH